MSIRVAHDRSKSSAPEAAAARSRPRQARYGLNCALPRVRIAPRPGMPDQTPKNAWREPISFEAGVAAQLELPPKTVGAFGMSRIVHGVTLFEIALDVQPPERADEIAHGVVTRLPNLTTCPGAVSVCEFRHSLIRFLQEQCGAGAAAAATD
jgi:hypothetical protein